ncbi:MAG TPA: hypothetical protein VM285_14180 [Polyangia bacterium]|nr:hypothetical protein [Polyangia bacterium]
MNDSRSRAARLLSLACLLFPPLAASGDDGGNDDDDGANWTAVD